MLFFLDFYCAGAARLAPILYYYLGYEVFTRGFRVSESVTHGGPGDKLAPQNFLVSHSSACDQLLHFDS